MRRPAPFRLFRLCSLDRVRRMADDLLPASPDEIAAAQNGRNFFRLKPFDAATEEEKNSRYAHVERLRKEGTSDVSRWSACETHRPEWQSRGHQLARYARPGESIFEFGAGLTVVSSSLPSSCRYTGSDLAPLNGDLLTFDLNADHLEPIAGHDAALLSGVLEYINDLNKAIDFFARCFKTILCSYASADDWSDTALLRRRYSGWVSDDGEATFIARFERVGYSLTNKGNWQDQSLFRFDRRSDVTKDGDPSVGSVDETNRATAVGNDKS